MKLLIMQALDLLMIVSCLSDTKAPQLTATFKFNIRMQLTRHPQSLLLLHLDCLIEVSELPPFDHNLSLRDKP